MAKAKKPTTEKKTSSVGLSVAEEVARLNEKYGVGTAIIASDIPEKFIRFMSTGSVGLDLSMGGGFPKNRITEIRGEYSALKSTITLKTIANMHARDPESWGIYLDAERTFNAQYADSLGCDLTRLLILTPDSGEQGVDLAKDVCGFNIEILMVIDSIAALVPTTEIQNDAEKQTMGLHARLVGKLMKILTARMKKTMYDPTAPATTILAINQLRQKIGVMFGCVTSDTTIPFTDGTSTTMRNLVDKKLKKKVWAQDKKTGNIVPARITNWFNNGKANSASDFVQIKAVAHDSVNGRMGGSFTRNHKLLTHRGWIEAGEVKRSDRLVSKFEETINGTLAEFLYGTLIGDSHLCGKSRTKGIQFADHTNPDYVRWKMDKLSGWTSFTAHPLSNKRTRKTYTVWQTESRTYELFKLAERIPKRNPVALLGDLTPLSLAVWYMDDGSYVVDAGSPKVTISVKRLRNDSSSLSAIKDRLLEMGYACNYYAKSGTIRILKEGQEQFFRDIASYVPDCMQYKLPKQNRGFYKDFKLAFKKRTVSEEVAIKEIKPRSPGFELGKYDIEVEGHHNYLVGCASNGFVVHNSPETTPGGVGKDFFYSTIIRLKATPSMAVKDKVKVGKVEHEFIVAQNVGYKIVKNKCCGTQFEEGEICFHKRKYKGFEPYTFDNIEPLFRFGVVYEIIKFEDECYQLDLGEGEDLLRYKREVDFKKALADLDEEYRTDLYMRILEKVTIVEGPGEVVEIEEEPTPAPKRKSKPVTVVRKPVNRNKRRKFGRE